jgi:hypothetical protein
MLGLSNNSDGNFVDYLDSFKLCCKKLPLDWELIGKVKTGKIKGPLVKIDPDEVKRLFNILIDDATIQSFSPSWK